MIINDLIILGRAFPQHLKDGRISCCTAGYSPTQGLIRIYPTDYQSEKLKQWNIVSVNVERNPNEWRKESWKIIDSNDWEHIDDKIEVIGQLPREERITLIETTIPKSCPNKLNEQKVSLGILCPKIISYYFAKNRKGHEVLRIRYKCTPECFIKGISHDAQVLEYGVDEWIRKYPNSKEGVIENLHLLDDTWRKHFLVGNGYHTPRSFMIISIIRWKL